jgi:hypothetical protein
MKKQRLVVPDEKMAELEIDLGDEDRKTIDLGRNFSSSDHRPLLDPAR